MKRLAVVLFLVLGVALPARAQQTYIFPEDPDTYDFVTANVIATFYHELGHAMIDVLALPVLGREEDAADTLSALLINDIWDEESAAILTYHTADAFQLYAAEAEAGGDETAYWGEHSLDMQRYYNLVCLYYGANPDLRADDATELQLPDDRAEGCPDEYVLAADSWGAMLEGLEPGKVAMGLRLAKGLAGTDLGELLAGEIKTLNESYALPEWVEVKVEACGEANAFYIPQERSIIICIEYAEDLQRLWESRG